MDQKERAKYEALTLAEISELIDSGTIEGDSLGFLHIRKGFLLEQEVKTAPAIETMTVEEITAIIESGAVHGSKLENLRERKRYLLNEKESTVKELLMEILMLMRNQINLLYYLL